MRTFFLILLGALAYVGSMVFVWSLCRMAARREQ